MKRIAYLLLAVWWLAVAPDDGWAAGETPTAVKTNRVSRPAVGISRPARPSKIVSSQQQRRILKARIAQINKKFSAIQKRVEKVQDQRLRRALKLRLKILHAKAIKRIQAEQHRHQRRSRKR